MGTRAALALGMTLTFVRLGSAGADSGPSANNPDGGAPLVVMPNSSAPAPAELSGETSGRPPPRALDSKRTPMPDRLANDHWLQYFPMAAPTPPVPDGAGASGGGASRVNTIRGSGGGAPADIPRDSVTRTPEDQLAPASPSEAP